LAFRRGLRDLGYIEGKNIVVEERYAGGKADRIPSLVAELVQLKVDILVSPVSAAIRAAKESTQTIPIVMVVADDPVATGQLAARRAAATATDHCDFVVVNLFGGKYRPIADADCASNLTMGGLEAV